MAIKIAGNEEKHRIAKEKAEDEHFAAKEAKAKALEAECHKSRQLQVKQLIIIKILYKDYDHKDACVCILLRNWT